MEALPLEPVKPSGRQVAFLVVFRRNAVRAGKEKIKLRSEVSFRHTEVRCDIPLQQEAR